jgi:hypothetical protein
MTFAEFQATRQHCDDLTTTDYSTWSEDDLAGKPTPTGLVYAGSLVIEEVKEHWPCADRGKHYLTLANEEYVSDDLAALEWKLYDYAIREGCI